MGDKVFWHMLEFKFRVRWFKILGLGLRFLGFWDRGDYTEALGTLSSCGEGSLNSAPACSILGFAL